MLRGLRSAPRYGLPGGEDSLGEPDEQDPTGTDKD